MHSSADSHVPGNLFSRAIARLRLVYIELQHWAVGLTPENYHWVKASAWEHLGRFDRTAKHLEAFLKTSDSPKARAWLAYAYSRGGHWADAEREYSQALESWRHPSVILAIAEANLMLSNTQRARELADLVELEFPERESHVDLGLRSLRDALGNATSEEGAG